MNQNQSIKIGDRQIGEGFPAYVIAELSANHNQDYHRAEEMIHAAKEFGADAVKLQTYTADTLTICSDKKWFKIDGGTLWDGKTLHELYQSALTPWDWQPKLKALADRIGIQLFSSPFDATAVDFLEKMNVPVYKVASFESGDIPLIQKIAATQKPVIMSTGLASLDEIREAVHVFQRQKHSQLALLKCTSAYPAPFEEMNLRAIPFLRETFRVPIGLSDHTLGFEVACAAVALGACIIEKHFTLSRKEVSADSVFSMEPVEFRSLIQAVRNVEKALGQPRHEIGEAEKKGLKFKRSLFAVQAIQAGEQLTEKNIRSIRPGYGLSPKFYDLVLSKTARVFIEAGTPLSWDILS